MGRENVGIESHMMYAASSAATTPLSRWLGGLRARIFATMGALMYGQGVTAVIQLVSLPLFLHFWDSQRYGKWILLTAVPAYFSMSDAGMIPVAANKINMLQAAGRTEESNTVFQSALALVLAALGTIAPAAGVILLFLGNRLLDADSCLALWLLIVSTLMGLFGGLFSASFRATGNNARGVFYVESIRVAEFAGLAAGLSIGGTFTAAAAGLLAGRTAGSAIVAFECRRQCPVLQWSLAKASRVELRTLLHPALAYLAFPLGNGLSIQAISLIVGALFGTVTVAVFNTYRTLSRLVLQVISTFSHAVLPEFSRLYGTAEADSLRNLYRRSTLFAGIASITLSLGMVISASFVLRVWTHGKIPFDAPLFLLFAFVTLVGGLAHVPRVLLLSTNRHSRLGAMYLVLATAGALFAVLLGELLGPSGVVLATAVPEAAMLYFSVIMGQRLLSEMPVGAIHA